MAEVAPIAGMADTVGITDMVDMAVITGTAMWVSAL
jgi:hypothetical protein